MSASDTGESWASCHSPPSTCTSTLEMPRPWAQATPAIGRRPGSISRSDAGVSIRAAVLTGPCGAQPRSTQ